MIFPKPEGVLWLNHDSFITIKKQKTKQMKKAIITFAILAVSLAFAKASANHNKQQLYQYFNEIANTESETNKNFIMLLFKAKIIKNIQLKYTKTIH
jgi:enolase